MTDPTVSSPFVQLVSHRTTLCALDADGTVWWFDEAYYDKESAGVMMARPVWRPLPAERVDK